MKERRNIIVFIICLLVLITLIGVPKLFLNKKEEILPEVKLKEIEKNRTFAIMVSDDTRDSYIPYKGDEWPTDDNDYYYSYSECVDNKGNNIENAIEYNQEENIANLKTNQTIYCTLYFDKYPYMYVPTHNVSCGENCTTPAPVYMSSKVKRVEFVDYIKDGLNSNEENTKWWDISDMSQGTPKGSVIAWIEPIDKNYDTLYIGSKAKIRAISLDMAFYPSEYFNASWQSNLESINFKDRLDTSKTINFISLFSTNKNLTQLIGLENWDVSNVTIFRDIVIQV